MMTSIGVIGPDFPYEPKYFCLTSTGEDVILLNVLQYFSALDVAESENMFGIKEQHSRFWSSHQSSQGIHLNFPCQKPKESVVETWRYTYSVDEFHRLMRYPSTPVTSLPGQHFDVHIHIVHACVRVCARWHPWHFIRTTRCINLVTQRYAQLPKRWNPLNGGHQFGISCDHSGKSKEMLHPITVARALKPLCQTRWTVRH